MSWFDWLPTALNIGGTLLNRSIANNAIGRATQAQVDAANRGTQAQIDAANAAKGYYASSATNDRNMQTQAAPGVAQQQQTIAQQNTLTPAQELAITQGQQQEQEQLASSGLAGSGRSNVAAQTYLQKNTTANFMNQNRGRGDQAASALSSQYFTSGRDINTQNANSATAGIEAGKAIAGGATQIGDAAAQGAIATGQQNTTATGQAINDIGAQIAAENKKYQSSYGNPLGSKPQQSTI